MRPSFVFVASLATTLTVLACFRSDTPVTPSTEPAVVAASIPCIGTDSTGDRGLYNEQRVFLESQGWWGKRRSDGVSVPKYGNAEHIHVAMCFPLRQTVSDTVTMIVRVLGHNLPVGSLIKVTELHDPDVDPGPNVGFLSINWNRTVTAADNRNVVLWDTVKINTRKVHDGLREFRNLTKVVRPPDPGQSVGAQLHASSGWCWRIENVAGDSPVNSGLCGSQNFPTDIQARGWYDCFEYKIAEVRNWTDAATPAEYPWTGIARNTAYKLKISGRDGAGVGNNTLVTGFEVRWDPNFHMDTLGTLIDSGSTAVTGRVVTVPAGKVTGPKIHKLVIMGRANQKCTAPVTGQIVPQDGEVSGVLAVPIKVR